MKILNLGILAHVDAGKTSLTERLLYNNGVIHTLGSVDTGNTQTDSLALEQKRGITIKSAVVSFNVGDLKINLIDTPGHPDFIAEVERALSVLDAVVLVISAVEGIQPQTRILMRALKRMRIPTIIFINKMDRMGARSDELVSDIKAKLFSGVIVMNEVADMGTRDVRVRPHAFDAAFMSELSNQLSRMEVSPIYYGSAIQGVGVNELTSALELLFSPNVASNLGEKLSASVFKIDRGTRDEKIAYLRMYSGELRVREYVTLRRTQVSGEVTEVEAKITALQTFQDGATIDTDVARAGEIVKTWGLSEAAINDYVGELPVRSKNHAHFTRPSLEVVVSPMNQSDAPKLFTALTRISEQDPFVEIRRRVRDNVLSVRICGEVQKEVIEDTLHETYGIPVTFSETSTICIERPNGTGEGVEIGVQGDPYLGTIGLHIEPAEVGSGVHYQRAKDVLGTMPDAFFVAVEETVKATLEEGLYGWQVTDCVVTLIKTGYWPRQSHAHASFDKSMSSTAGNFRHMTPLALMAALKQAGVTVYEPMNRFELDIPQSTLSTVMQSLAAVEARLTDAPVPTGETIRLEGLLPARKTFAFERSIPDLTNGEGSFMTEFGEYQAALGAVPTRERTDNNPINREDYLKRISERV